MRFRCGVEIGAYSYGPCFELGILGEGTIVGRYVSIASRLRVYQANHPFDTLSTHGFFFNSALGYVPSTSVPFTRLRIEHDVWIGDSVIVTPGCRRIGLGAVVGAGSIVTKDVPDFSVVAGNPARVIKPRFTPDIQRAVSESRWWDLPVSALVGDIELFCKPLGDGDLTHPLLSRRC